MRYKQIAFLLILAVTSNIVLLMILVHNLGKNQSLEQLNNLYLSAACQNLDAFHQKLQDYDLRKVVKTITEEEKEKWIDMQMSKCG